MKYLIIILLIFNIYGSAKAVKPCLDSDNVSAAVRHLLAIIFAFLTILYLGGVY